MVISIGGGGEFQTPSSSSIKSDKHKTTIE